MRRTGKAGGATAQPAAIRAALRAAVLPALALLAACQQDTDPGPGGATVAEARALDDAAQMLDQQRLPHNTAPQPGTESAPGD